MKHLPKKTAATYELGQQSGERLRAAIIGRRDIETSAVEWYRGFSRGLGGEPLAEVEQFITNQCQRIGDADRRDRKRSELAILDVLASSPLDLLPLNGEEPRRKPRAKAR